MTAVTRVDFRRQIAMTKGETKSETQVDIAPSQPETKIKIIIRIFGIYLTDFFSMNLSEKL